MGGLLHCEISLSIRTALELTRPLIQNDNLVERHYLSMIILTPRLGKNLSPCFAEISPREGRKPSFT
jgi:hypothetical protein